MPRTLAWTVHSNHSDSGLIIHVHGCRFLATIAELVHDGTEILDSLSSRNGADEFSFGTASSDCRSQLRLVGNSTTGKADDMPSDRSALTSRGMSSIQECSKFARLTEGNGSRVGSASMGVNVPGGRPSSGLGCQ